MKSIVKGPVKDEARLWRQLSIVIHLLIVFISLGAIIYLNLVLIRYWFSGEFNQNLGSI